jgi:hypothetical protein
MVTTMGAETDGVAKGFTVIVAPVSPGPALAEQVIGLPPIVTVEFSRFARMVPAPKVSAITVVVTSALTPWILNFDTSIEDHPSFEGFSTTSPGGDRSFDR